MNREWSSDGVDCRRRGHRAATVFAMLMIAVLFADSAAAQRGDAQEKKRRIRSGTVADIPAPSDPAAVKGRWTIGGKTETITAGEFHRVHSLVNKLEGSAQRSVSDRDVWEYLLAAREAEFFGLEVTDAELDDMLEKDDPDLYGGLVKRWIAQKVSEAEGREYKRTRELITKLKDLFVNNARATVRDAFDIFKQNHLEYRLEYVLFSTKDYEKEIDASKLDDAELRRFWTERLEIQREFRSPATVSGEILRMNPKTFPLTDAERIAGGRSVDRKEALEYFWKNKAALLTQVPAEEQHRLVIKEGTSLDAIVSPFQVLEPTIKKMILLGSVIETARAEAAELSADQSLEATAKKYGLDFEKIDKVDRAKSINLFRRYDFQLFNEMSQAAKAQISEVKDRRGLRFFFRLDDKTTARLPEFDEVKEKLREKYIDFHAREKARSAARAVVTEMREKTESAIKEDAERIQSEAIEDAEKRIAEIGITREQDKNRERTLARQGALRSVEAKRSEVMPSFFDAIVKERGLRTATTEHFELRPIRPQERSSDVAKARQEFLESSYFLRSLRAGQVASVLLEDPLTGSYFIVRLLDRRDPPIATMGPVNLMQNMTQFRQRQENELIQRWRYQVLQNRLQLQAF